MNELFIIGGIAAVAGGYLLSDSIFRNGTVEELRILMTMDSTNDLLSGEWGVEDFPVFFKADWKDDKRTFYMKLMKSMKAPIYGTSNRLLRSLIRIEDERQREKGSEESDKRFTKRTIDVLESYKPRDDFSGFLAAFIEKRHRERI